MKLKPREKQLKPVPLRLKVPGELQQDLTDYAEYYQAIYKEPIEHPELALLMIEQFMMADSGFKAWRRGQEEPQARPARPNSFSSSNPETGSHDRS